MRSKTLVLALLMMMLLASQAFGVGPGKRQMLKTNQVVYPEFIMSTATFYTDLATGDNTEVVYFEFEAESECDLQVQYRTYLSGMPSVEWYAFFTAYAAGEYVNPIFGWTTARNFSNSMTTSYSFDAVKFYLKDVAEVGLSANFVTDMRYRVRYLNAVGDTITTGFTAVESIIDPRASDSTVPVKLANGSCIGMDFAFGEGQTLIVLSNFQADDGKAIDNLAFEMMVVDQGTGATMFQSGTPVIGTFGAGTNYGGLARIPGYMATHLAAGRRYFQVSVRLTDGYGNRTGWLFIDTVDLQDPLAP